LITLVSAITRFGWQEENPRWDLKSEDDAAEDLGFSLAN
jgi:hypothetical protein